MTVISIFSLCVALLKQMLKCLKCEAGCAMQLVSASWPVNAMKAKAEISW
jgi:hypothetical protein